MKKTVRIKDKLIGDGQLTYIIAEMSGNHAGDINRAIEIIHAAKESGADCIKIQTYTADLLTMECYNDYFKIKSGTWGGEYLYELYNKAFTPWEWQAKLKEEAEKIGLHFFSTPVDKTSVDFLESIGVEFYKIGSYELTNLPLIEYAASKGKPMIISTGMGSLGEIEEAVNTVRNAGNNELCLLRCSSSYPAIPDDMNLRTINNLSEIFSVPVGLSDHSMGSVASIVAVALGAKIIEKHFCISREIENPDASFSMEPQEFKQMVLDIRAAERAMGQVNYEITNSDSENRKYRESVFVVQDIKMGETLSDKNVKIIRPAFGLEPKYYGFVLGKKAKYNIKRGTPLEWNMVE